MAIEDIRLYLSIRTCRKYKRFKRIVGPGALEYLAWFWMAVAEAAPSGDITSWNEFEIADAAGYPGDPAELYNALVDCRFVDANENGPERPHNWPQRQPYIYHAPRRSLQAKLANAKRWGNKDEYTRLYTMLHGKTPTSQPVSPNRTPDSTPDGSPPYPLPYPKDIGEQNRTGPSTVQREKICDVCKSKPVDQPHHTKCRTCYQPNYSRPPPGRHNVYPKCPYCKREQSGIEINHQTMTCSICKDEPPRPWPKQKDDT
jgi:hypothetical protein